MSRDKQIEEMASDLENHTCMSQFQAKIASRTLYAIGYRKASEIFEEIERMCIDTFGNFSFRTFTELKKKYTGEWEKRDCSNCKNRNEKGCSFNNMCITSNSRYATPSHWKAKESEKDNDQRKAD